MSYDVDVNGHSFNYTRNLREFFQRFEVYPPNWAGRNRFEVAKEIDAALRRIEVYDISSLKATYDAPNGWGTVDHAILWLKEVAAAMAQPHDDIVEVSW